MSTHLWVHTEVARVEVEETDDGSLNVFIPETAGSVAQEQGVTCCVYCEVVLTTESFKTECSNIVTHQSI